MTLDLHRLPGMQKGEVPENCVVMKVQGKHKGYEIAVVTYYLRPGLKAEEVVSYFEKLENLCNILHEDLNLRTIMVSDANAKRGLDQNEEWNLAGKCQVELEQRLGHARIAPRARRQWTCRSRRTNKKAASKSIIDHISAHDTVVDAVEETLLDEKVNLRTDHTAIRWTLRLDAKLGSAFEEGTHGKEKWKDWKEDSVEIRNYRRDLQNAVDDFRDELWNKWHMCEDEDWVEDHLMRLRKRIKHLALQHIGLENGKTRRVSRERRKDKHARAIQRAWAMIRRAEEGDESEEDGWSRDEEGNGD